MANLPCNLISTSVSIGGRAPGRKGGLSLRAILRFAASNQRGDVEPSSRIPKTLHSQGAESPPRRVGRIDPEPTNHGPPTGAATEARPAPENTVVFRESQERRPSVFLHDLQPHQVGQMANTPGVVTVVGHPVERVVFLGTCAQRNALPAAGLRLTWAPAPPRRQETPNPPVWRDN